MLNQFYKFYRDCFVDNYVNSLRSFVKCAGKTHRALHYALGISDNLWVLYILEMTQQAMSNPDFRKKKIVTCVGRQPSSNTWVFSPEIHINEKGELIPLEQQDYYW